MTEPIRPLPPDLTQLLFDLGGRRLVLVEGEIDADVLHDWFDEHLAGVTFHPGYGKPRPSHAACR